MADNEGIAGTMNDCVVSVFRLSNARGYSVPALNVDYRETDTGFEWRLTCGGTRAYVVRIGQGLAEDLNEQAADSHFMIRRITSSLLLGGVGLFQAEAVGRLLFRGLEGTITWTAHLDRVDPLAEDETDTGVDRVYGWCQALCQHHVLRRAADDAHLALSFPHEAIVFVYRGLEWLKCGQGIEWEDIAKDLGVSLNHLRDLKKMANYDTGVRHASSTGSKMRACPRTYGTWVCGLLEGVNCARERLQPGFIRMTPQEVSDAVTKAVPVFPYP